jgi:hypothetical protein
MTEESHSIRYSIFLVLGIFIGMAIEYRPPIRAEVKTEQGTPEVSGAFISGPVPTGFPMSGPSRAVLNAAVGPDGYQAVIHVDDRGRVIAKCDLEP